MMALKSQIINLYLWEFTNPLLNPLKKKTTLLIENGKPNRRYTVYTDWYENQEVLQVYRISAHTTAGKTRHAYYRQNAFFTSLFYFIKKEIPNLCGLRDKSPPHCIFI